MALVPPQKRHGTPLIAPHDCGNGSHETAARFGSCKPHHANTATMPASAPHRNWRAPGSSAGVEFSAMATRHETAGGSGGSSLGGEGGSGGSGGGGGGAMVA